MLKSIVNGAEHDIEKIPMKTRNLCPVSQWTNDQTDTRYPFQAHLSATGAPNTYKNISSEGRYSLTVTGFTSGRITFKHNGASKDLYIYRNDYSFDEPVSITVSFYVEKYDPREVGGIVVRDIMLNTGSTALPYEPYGYQNGWEIRDNQNRIIWGREDELQTTTGTLLFKGYNLPVKVNSLLGNSVQNGTPAPDNVVVPEFCGVLNDNLAIIESDSRTITNWYYYDVRLTDVIPAGTYTLSFSVDSKTGTAYSGSIGRGTTSGYSADVTYINIGSDIPVNIKKTFTLTESACVWARFLRVSSPSTFSYSVSKIRIEEGSTAYGYKIPFTCAGQTTPIYLGEVPTIRRIKKLVLTGEETYIKDSAGEYLYYVYVTHLYHTDCLCSHLESTTGYPVNKEGCSSYNNASIIYFNFGSAVMNAQPSGNTVAGLKEYLTAQYANGTPVTVWYVLSEQQTGIVNEPLARIGNYADELTEISVHSLSAPLYGIGDYKDILNLSTGVLTRNIKKLVLTGEETITGYNMSATGIGFRIDLRTMKMNMRNNGYCTHFQPQLTPSGSGIDGVTFGANSNSIYFTFSAESVAAYNLTNLESIKTFLATQYANGTPVEVWYVLETSETETVTVPTGMTGEIEGYLTQISTPTPEHPSIPKWNGKEETGGTYAVTVYDLPEIPTTTGKNTLTVDTTLAPYDVTINGHIKYTYWGKIREDVRSGLAQTKFPVGTILYDNEDETTGRAFQVVGYDKHFDPSLTARGFTHSMTLCQLKLSGPWQFDAIEAFLYTTVEMQPGTYKFKIPNYDTTYGGNKTYYFTSTATVPVDSQIVLRWDYQKPPASVTAYAGPNPQTKTTAITGFNALQLSEWVEGESPEAIDLGTIKLSNNDPDSAYGKLNHIHRARYGSNNYYQSGLRQLLNTDLASNNWWNPTTIFDRPYGNRTTNGYLRSLNEDFINVLATPEITHITNNVFEYPSLDGRTFALNTEYKINTDKVFLLSHTEVGLSSAPNVGTILDYYSTHNTNSDRIKYRIDNGNAYYWWFRTPYPSYANNFRYCSASGALSDNYAIVSDGVAPAHIIQ